MRLGSKKQAGFTLFELMVTMLIAGVLVALAVPNMNSSMARSKIYGDYKSIRDVLRTAKSASQSDKTFDSVLICPGNESSCSGTWSDGFVVVGDVNASGTFDAGDVVLAVQDKLSRGTSLTVTDQNAGGAVINSIRLTTQGYTANFGAANAPSYLFTYCNSAANSRVALGVVYGPGGVIRMTTDSNGDSIQDYGGTNLVCP